MIVIDDKSTGVITSGKQLFLSSGDFKDDVTFKASFIVTSDLHCDGSIVALFDLIVFGDIEAEEIDIKGRFVCLGNCKVSGKLLVQTDIWAEDIQAAAVVCHDRIVAQSIDAETVYSDSNIIVGKTLAIEEKAETYQNIICGETAFGAGRLIASKVLTTDPLDMDDGTEAIESPFAYFPTHRTNSDTGITKEASRFAVNNDYAGYLSLISAVPELDLSKRCDRYLAVLKTVENDYPSSISKLTDVSILLWLIEIVHSDIFANWDIISNWTEETRKHFVDMAEGKNTIALKEKPANKLLKGYTITHSKYGFGTVLNVTSSQPGSKQPSIAEINFSEFGKKKFPIPDSLKYFTIISETPLPSSEEIRQSITCEINSYAEWISALSISNQYKEYLGDALYHIVFDLLLDKIGLKAVFVENRFKEKGWN